MAKRKATAEELLARAESNGYKRGAYRGEDSTRGTPAGANFDTNKLHTRWTLSQMQKDALQRCLPTPDEACARHHSLHEGVQATPTTITAMLDAIQVAMQDEVETGATAEIMGRPVDVIMSAITANMDDRARAAVR